MNFLSLAVTTCSKCNQSSVDKISIISISIYYISIIYSDWVCTAVMSNDVMKDLRG